MEQNFRNSNSIIYSIMTSQGSKTKRFEIRTSTEEKEALFLRAQKLGYSSVSAYILDAALKKEIKNYDIEYKMFHLINELYAEFGRIGNNINQIAKHLNTHKDELPTKLLEEMSAELNTYNEKKETLINCIKQL